MAVGRSSRTPFKHWLLYKELGRLAGIFSIPSAADKCPAVANPFLVVDLCAGDGLCTDVHRSSPSIICQHLQWADVRGVRVEAHFIEKDGFTFQQLDANTPNLKWVNKVYGDAKEWKLPSPHRKQAVFIHSDPNSIADWPITDELIGNLSETTTMLATLGCNVGGLKRLKRDERQEWFEHVRKCVDAMPNYHDALLVALEGDSAQWAYLLRLPVKWTDKTQAAIASEGRKHWDRGFRFASLRGSFGDFTALQNELFLQGKERGGAA